MKYLSAFLLLSLVSCSIRDNIINLSLEKSYYNTLTDNEQVLWDSLRNLAYNDQVEITIPYLEKLAIDSLQATSFGYKIQCSNGEKLIIQLDTIDAFVEIFKIENDSTQVSHKIYEQDVPSEKHELEIYKTGSYFIRLQTKLKLSNDLSLKIYAEPVYTFPVAGGKTRDIGSFWGDARDGGKRKHKGIDIFAKKGTPLIASVNGRVRTVRDRGLGGKQIWLADQSRGQTLYYAHLNEQYVEEGEFVYQGDTIGTVGNTGNARTTPPHLHFAIYKSKVGAIDPIFFIRENRLKFDKPNAATISASQICEVSVKEANLRAGPSNRNIVLSKLKQGEFVSVIGITGNWYHIRTNYGMAGFVYKSSIKLVQEST